jgi:hypothetical protein
MDIGRVVGILILLAGLVLLATRLTERIDHTEESWQTLSPHW